MLSTERDLKRRIEFPKLEKLDYRLFLVRYSTTPSNPMSEDLGCLYAAAVNSELRVHKYLLPTYHLSSAIIRTQEFLEVLQNLDHGVLKILN